MRAKVRCRKYLHTPVPAATQCKCLVHTSLWLKTSESLRKLMLHMQACVNTYSYILLHASFVLAFSINAVNCFMRMSIYKKTHTRMSVLVHWHVSCVVQRCCIVSLEPWLPLVYCQKQSHPPHTCIHLSPPRKHTCVYALVYDSKTNPSHRKHVLHMHVHVCTYSYVLVYAYLLLLFR